MGCLTQGNFLAIILAGLRNTTEKSVSLTVLQDCRYEAARNCNILVHFILVTGLLLSVLLRVFCATGDFEVIYQSRS